MTFREKIKAFAGKFAGIIAILSTIGVSCQACYGSPLPQPAVITDVDQCVPACDHLQKLNCEEGKDITGSDGKVHTCVEWCYNTERNGYANVWLNPTCVSAIAQCSDIESCAVKK